jgi:hypothetical protein
VTRATRRRLLLELAQRHIAAARRGGAQAIAALRDAAICALLATRDDDNVALPDDGQPAPSDEDAGGVRTNAKGGSA